MIKTKKKKEAALNFPFTFPPAMYRRSFFSAYSPIFGIWYLITIFQVLTAIVRSHFGLHFYFSNG